MADLMNIRVRLSGARQAAAEARGLASAVKHAGDQSSASTRQMATAERRGRALTGAVGGALATGAKRGALALGAVGTAAAAMGLKFDSSMETNITAFKHFLGSADRAKKFTQDLYNIAAHTPFEFPQVTDAAKRFLAFGFSAKEAKKNLMILGDAASGLGTGAEGIDRMVLALGQMKSTGVVQGDELRQLQEAGINVNRYLIKAGLITKDDIGQIGNLHLSSDKAIKAITAGMRKDFGGLSQAQSKTFAGQLSTLRDNAAQAMGKVFRPLFNYLRNTGMPLANKAIGALTGNGTLSQRVRRAWGILKPEIDRQLHRASTAFNQYAPKFMNAAATLARKAAVAFVKAWWHSGIWAKLITVAFLAGKLGAFKWAGGKAAVLLWGAFKPRLAGLLAGLKALIFGPSTSFGTSGGNNAGNKFGSRFRSKLSGIKGLGAIGNKLGPIFGKAFGATAVLAIAAEIGPKLQQLLQIGGPGGDGGTRDLKRNYSDPRQGGSTFMKDVPIIGKYFRAAGGPVTAGSRYIVGEEGAEAFTPRQTGSIIPNHMLGAPRQMAGNVGRTQAKDRLRGDEEIIEQPIITQVLLDGKVLAESQGKIAKRRAARR